MANDNETRMPTSQGGLTMYFDEDTGIELDPKVVIGVTATVAVVVTALNIGILT